MEQLMNELSQKYLTKKQALEKYAFFSSNMIKNLLFRNIGGFRSKVARKLGRRILLDEIALLKFLSECSSESTLQGGFSEK
jgi:hypothetical protein